MTTKHRALIVEDVEEHARDLQQILEEECACESVVVSNKEDALRELAGPPFCILLLDLEILPDSGAITPFVRHGREVLREARKRYPEGVGTKYVTPIVVVSGFAREGDEVASAFDEGASDVVQKLSPRKQKIERIYAALEKSGRLSHARCRELAATNASQATPGSLILTIPARRHKQRFVVTVAGREARLRASSLEVLLLLVKAHLSGKPVYRDEIQAPDTGGVRLVSELHRDMESALLDIEVSSNDQHGYYDLHEKISLGEINTAMLATIDERRISKLAREIRNLLEQKATLDGKA